MKLRKLRGLVSEQFTITRIKTIDRETIVQLLNNNFTYDEIA